MAGSSSVNWGILKLIGNTPVVKLRGVGPGEVFIKLEYLNPTGSHKDRIAYYMIKDAMDEGVIRPGDAVIEASSGNTAISVAWVSSLLGLKCYIVVEEGTSPSKVNLIRSLGAEVRFAPKVPPDRPDNILNYTRRLAGELGAYFLYQHGNESNFRAHYETTARELHQQLGGKVDIVVAGVGTGGTVAAVGKYFKERLGERVKVVAVVPRGSPIVTGKPTVGEPIEGLSTTTVPELFTRYRDVVDEVMEVPYEEALKTMVRVAREEGVLGGLTTGANIYAVTKILREHGRKDLRVATFAFDSTLRYTHLITGLRQIRT